MKINRINIIGFGNVGFNLYENLKNKVEIGSIYTNSILKIKKYKLLNLTNDINELSEDVDLNIISVTDSSISDIMKKLPKNIPIVHTSGGIDIEVGNKFNNYGVLYPLQTFSFGKIIQLSSVPVLIEANSAKFYSEIVHFVSNNISCNIHKFDSKERESIHLAAVFANNFTTLMLREAESIMKENNKNFDLLKPLIYETIEKCFDNSPSLSQTGPASRGDIKVVNKYFDLINNNERKKIYKLLTDRIMNL